MLKDSYAQELNPVSNQKQDLNPKPKPKPNNELPPIPDKRYFTIGEVSRLCAVKPHVLRYWEQEFSKLKPVKRKNRRYYEQKDVLIVRHIRNLLYRQGFTIEGARLQLAQLVKQKKSPSKAPLISKTAEPEVKVAVTPQLDEPDNKAIEIAISGLQDILENLDGDVSSNY